MARRPPTLVNCLLALVAAGAGAEAVGVAASRHPLPVPLRSERAEVVQELLAERWALVDDAGEMVRAWVLFEKPLDRVYELLAATTRQAEYRGELEGVATVARLPDGHVDEHRIRLLFVAVDYRLRYRLDPERKRIAWELDRSAPTPMRRVEGSWELFAMDASRTLGRLATAVDVGDALPRFLETAITRTTLPRTLERCRRWVDADGVAP